MQFKNLIQADRLALLFLHTILLGSLNVNAKLRVRRGILDNTLTDDFLVRLENDDGDLVNQFRVRRHNPKEEESLFSNNFTLQSLDTDVHGRQVVANDPSLKPSDLKEREKGIYVEPESHTVVRLDDKGQISGIVAGRSMDGGGVVDVHDGVGNRPRDDLNDVKDLHRDYKPLVGRAIGGIPNAEPELFVILDYDNSLQFNHEPKLVIDYLTVFFKAVNDRYETLKTQIKVRFKVSNLLLVKSYEAQPFIDKGIMTGGGTDSHYDTSKILDAFNEWLFDYKQTQPDHKFDIAVLITAKDIYGANVPDIDNPAILKPQQIAGLAPLAGACLTMEEFKSYYGGLVVKDVGGRWQGVGTVAHELAHNLGANHDGTTTTNGKADSSKCPWEDGFIMSYLGEGTKNKFFFSSCSVSAMKEFITSDGATCIKQTDGENQLQEGKGSKMPTMAEQCIKFTNSTAAVVNTAKTPDELCLQLSCWFPHPKDPELGGFTLEQPGVILDGMVCDEATHRVCHDGDCIAAGGAGEAVGASDSKSKKKPTAKAPKKVTTKAAKAAKATKPPKKAAKPKHTPKPKKATTKASKAKTTKAAKKPATPKPKATPKAKAKATPKPKATPKAKAAKKEAPKKTTKAAKKKEASKTKPTPKATKKTTKKPASKTTKKPAAKTTKKP